MSNIYIQEPPTNGKILFHTTVGEIEVELWSKEAPRAARNMIQLCLEGYYDGVIFHRIIKGFMAQTGDPSGTGLGGESIYGKPFRDEFHSRIKFNRRGLVGLANAGKDDNGSQFFFTFGPSPELNNKHTIVGKVVGNTLYNMLKLEEFLVDRNDKPKDPPKIIKTEILSNPFDDILPRTTISDEKKSGKNDDKIEPVKGMKDFSLLSFGEEAEEEEELLSSATEYKGKSKSSHDLLTDDPKLSSVPVVDPNEFTGDGKRKSDDQDKKSKKKKHKKEREYMKIPSENVPEDDGDDSDVDEKSKAEKEKLEAIKNEYKLLKKEMASAKKKDVVEEKIVAPKDDAVVEFLEQKEKYKNVSKSLSKKGSSREEQALALLAKFKNKLAGSKESDVPPSESWIKHKFTCEKEDEKPVLAKDANMRGENDWYDIYDPRNKMNQRKAEMGSTSSGRKK